MSLTLARLGVVAGSFPIAAGGDFESIATVTVGSGGASSIEFTSIPSTYQHLQIRFLSRTDGTERIQDMRLNGVTSSSYASHNLYGTGSSATAEAFTSQTAMKWNTNAISTDAASTLSACVVDILDYASTSKNTTIRYVAGRDHNGSGLVMVGSGLFNNTNAVSSITLLPGGGNWAQHSTAALYGVKAP